MKGLRHEPTPFRPDPVRHVASAARPPAAPHMDYPMNIRRTGIAASKNGKMNPDYAAAVAGIPTSERLALAGIDLVIGGDERTGRRYVMQDNPLDRAFKKGVLSGSGHSALQKYRHHWYHAGHAPTISSVDLDRIYSAEPCGPAGMPRSEGQVFHRQRWREARGELGDKSCGLVDNLVCGELSLELCGYAMGWKSKPQAIAAATAVLQDSGYRLSKLWGIG